jgi:hypothetical protein
MHAEQQQDNIRSWLTKDFELTRERTAGQEVD